MFETFLENLFGGFSDQDLFIMYIASLVAFSVGSAIALGILLCRVGRETRLSIVSCLNVVAFGMLAYMTVPIQASFADEFPEDCEGVFLEFSNWNIIGGCKHPDGYLIWDDEALELIEVPDLVHGNIRRVYPWWRATKSVHDRYEQSIEEREPLVDSSGFSF